MTEGHTSSVMSHLFYLCDVIMLRAASWVLHPASCVLRPACCMRVACLRGVLLLCVHAASCSTCRHAYM